MALTPEQFNVLKENNVPYPDIIISSVGAEIYYDYRGRLIYSTGWEAHIKHQWNREKIKKLLARFDFLQYQEEDAQRKFKISYYTSDVPKNLEKVKSALIKNKIKANVNKELLPIVSFIENNYTVYNWRQ